MRSRAERVAAGAAWLDEQKPDWFHQVNLNSLDTSSNYRCVAGQVFGSYPWAPLPHSVGLDISEIRKRHRWAAQHGFNGYRIEGEYDALDQLWIAEINKRREARPA